MLPLSSFAFKPFIYMSKKLLHEDNNLVSDSDCKWENWTECTKTCGRGTRSRMRYRNGVEPCDQIKGPCNDFYCDGKCTHYFIYSRLAYLWLTSNDLERHIENSSWHNVSTTNYSCGSLE